MTPRGTVFIAASLTSILVVVVSKCFHLMTVQWRSTGSRLLLSCLLASYIIAMLLYSANATASDPNEFSAAAASLVTPPPSSRKESSSLIVCAVDGSIYTIDALTGMAKGYFGTGRPLVGSSSRLVVPGLDGSIYTLDPNSDKVQVLPLTVKQVVQHPVQTCNGDECGVVTGTKHTFLYGLDPSTGRLEWTQQFGKTDPHESSNDVVILHREDYVVRHISTSTGEELWNVTLGHVSALDFSTTSTLWDANSKDAHLLSGRNAEKQKEPAASAMPSIAFGSEGTTVTAMDEDDQILWRRKLNTVIASVYGVVGNDFVPVTVVETRKEQIEAQGSHTALVPLFPPQRSQQQRDVYLELLWKEVKGMSAAYAAGEGKMVVFQPPPKNYRTSAELNRLAQKATKQECQGITVEGICYETPLLEAGQSKQHQQPGGIYLTWDRLFVTVVLLGVGIRVLIAHNRRMWNAERQKASSSTPRKQVPADRLLQRRELSLSEHSPRMVDLGPLGDRVASLPDLAVHFNTTTTSPGEKSKLWNLERVGLHRASTAPAGAVDTPTSSSSGQIDGIPFVKHSRYLSEFREIGPLGKGGFGTVFRCENVLDGRQYAIKKVRISSGDEFSQRLQRVLREIKSLAKLDHPNIVRYYTAWLEAEEDNGEKETDAMDGSNTSIGRCYSVEHMTSYLPEETSDGRRPPTSPSVVKKKSLPPMYNDMKNPLGWNGGISMDPSFDDKDQSVSQEGSDFGGFHFDRSSDSWDNADFEEEEEEYSNDSSSALEGDSKEALLARSPGESTATPMFSNRRRSSIDLSSDSDKPSKSTESQSAPETKNVRHTLYIQMHLCSQKTLGDFLSNEEARRGTAVESTVDIPLALSLFHQIAEGVKHVHEQGLIHRDLKPSNCFIDDGVVKVGDFGLSRESSEPSASSEEPRDDWLGSGDAGEDFSAGIGTRAYASPEQQKGSNYDSSTDVYSLGIMLFELCYPMCTVSFFNRVAHCGPPSYSPAYSHSCFVRRYFLQGMERNIVFSRLRQREFPQDWQDTVAASFPIVHSLLASMLSPRSQDRPSAATVASRVESLLGEYTVLHLDRKGHEDGCTLLRVEAAAHEGVLPHTIQLIKYAAPNVVVEQYGLRSQDSKAIMEFALSSTNEDSLVHILSELRSSTDVHVARQISDSVTVKL
jgi:serine/threonine protein kinase